MALVSTSLARSNLKIHRCGLSFFRRLTHLIIAFEAIECGAMGFVCKTGAAADIRHAVRAAARGERWLSDNVAQQVALLKVRAEEPVVSLTQRELKVMKLLAQGGRTKEISDEMGISRKTVANICAALKKKFNARTSSEVIRIAIDLELL